MDTGVFFWKGEVHKFLNKAMHGYYLEKQQMCLKCIWLMENLGIFCKDDVVPCSCECCCASGSFILKGCFNLGVHTCCRL